MSRPPFWDGLCLIGVTFVVIPLHCTNDLGENVAGGGCHAGQLTKAGDRTGEGVDLSGPLIDQIILSERGSLM